MAQTKESLRSTRGGYALRGTLLEACNCGVLCPCWIGEDPDDGECWAVAAYHFDAGQIDGVDVSGLSIVDCVVIPGNIFEGGWKQVVFVDDEATLEQKDAILRAFSGQLGGPLADLAALVEEVLAVIDVPITHELVGGKGTLRIDGMVEAEMEPYTGPDGTTTTLRDSAFSTVPGSPAYVAKASRCSVNLPEHGMVWSFEGRNAIQSDWKLEHVA